jgi:hypothetical protein
MPETRVALRAGGGYDANFAAAVPGGRKSKSKPASSEKIAKIRTEGVSW